MCFIYKFGVVLSIFFSVPWLRGVQHKKISNIQTGMALASECRGHEAQLGW